MYIMHIDIYIFRNIIYYDVAIFEISKYITGRSVSREINSDLRAITANYD